MHAIINGCFDSWNSPFTILTGGKNHLKQAPISLADIKIPTDKMRDEMFSSESGDSSNLPGKTSGSYSSKKPPVEEEKMHRVVDCCFDSQKSPFTVLTEGRSPLKQISIPLEDINIPNLNMKDEMYSSGNSSNSNLQK